MMIDKMLDRLPDTDKKVIVTHSGGMDSSTAIILAVEKYGKENVISLGFDYGQKQKIELEYASRLCNEIGVTRHILDLSILGEIVKNVSANIGGTDIEMPTIKDVLGNPQPPTYVPYRNLIMFSLTAAFAEANAASQIICGLQIHDEYSYWDTTQKFVDSFNDVTAQNRSWPVTLIAPFSDLSKTDEVKLLIALDKDQLLKYSLTCYNPKESLKHYAVNRYNIGISCGNCPSCAERIAAFVNLGIPDPIEGGYQIEVPW
jgi:7-cyano-7-deazaguanine synthase